MCNCCDSLIPIVLEVSSHQDCMYCMLPSEELVGVTDKGKENICNACTSLEVTVHLEMVVRIV